MENSIGWWLAKWAFLTPAREAYVGDDGERLTFAELNARCNRVANAFAAAGVGERVGLLLMNSTEFLEFEMDLRGAMLRGSARGASEVLSELDGELAVPSCEGVRGSRMRRRARTLSLLGRLELKRGYWTCPCAKGGARLLDRALEQGRRQHRVYAVLCAAFPAGGEGCLLGKGLESPRFGHTLELAERKRKESR